MTDQVTPASSPAKGWLRQQIESLPPAVHTAVIVVMLAVVVWAVVTGKLSPSVVVNNLPTPAETPTETLTPAPEVVEGRFHPGRTLFCKVVRKKLKTALTADGFNLVGGNPTPLSEAAAEELLSNLEDEYIAKVAVSSGTVQDGVLGGRLTNLLDWILAHQDQIASLVKLLMTILMLL